MSAIAGYWVGSSQTPIGENEVRKALESMGHRGAPSTAVFRGKGSMIAMGADPADLHLASCYDETHQIGVVIDGEIFSCVDGQVAGTAAGADAELIARLYLRYDLDFPQKIDGSYSIAILDQNRDRLLLVRDRVGYKPLFFSRQANGLCFGSEIKAILALLPLKRTADLAAINHFLSFGYVPNPRTMFEHIKHVKPGELLLMEGGSLRAQKYWGFSYEKVETEEPDGVYVERFLEIFTGAVERRLKRHPDAGAFLSGGLDTSAVTAVMRKVTGKSFKTFCAGFREGAYNEIEDARVVADHLDLEFFTTLVEFKEDFPSLLEKIVWHHDAPFADTSAIPSYFAARLAREHVDTVLTGDFPDQLIGGSGHQVAALSRQKGDPLWKRCLRSPVLGPLIRTLPWGTAAGTSFFDKAKRFLHRESYPLELQRVILNMPIPPLLKRHLYGTDLLEVDRHFDPVGIAQELYGQVAEEDLLNRILYFDVLSYAADDLMVKVERMTAAHGLKAFSPFHDVELVRFIAGIPSRMKIRNGVRKLVQREAVRPFLPDSTMSKRKQGFAMPIGEWLVTNLSGYVRDILLDDRTLKRGYFKEEPMTRMVENYLAGRTDYATGSEAAIISLLTLELWHRLFVDL